LRAAGSGRAGLSLRALEAEKAAFDFDARCERRLFSIALDASYDGRFATARTHLRLGVFLKLLFDDDGNAHADPFPGASGRTETEWHSQRTIEHGRVLQRIATDVGLLLYLNEKIRCSCLRDPSFRATAAAWYALGSTRV
jgi:hypothetical protein